MLSDSENKKSSFVTFLYHPNEFFLDTLDNHENIMLGRHVLVLPLDELDKLN